MRSCLRDWMRKDVLINERVIKAFNLRLRCWWWRWAWVFWAGGIMQVMTCGCLSMYGRLSLWRGWLGECHVDGQIEKERERGRGYYVSLTGARERVRRMRCVRVTPNCHPHLLRRNSQEINRRCSSGGVNATTTTSPTNLLIPTTSISSLYRLSLSHLSPINNSHYLLISSEHT